MRLNIRLKALIIGSLFAASWAAPLTPADTVPIAPETQVRSMTRVSNPTQSRPGVIEHDEVAQNTSKYRVRSLNDSELDSLRNNLGSEHHFYPEHCFVLRSGSMWGGQFISAKVSNALNLRWQKSPSEIFPLPVPEYSWSFYQLRAVTFGDFNNDGKGPDVLTLTEYITGVGPNGAVPFMVSGVYLYNSDYNYSYAKEISEQLTDQGVSSIAQAERFLSEFRVDGSRYPKP